VEIASPATKIKNISRRDKSSEKTNFKIDKSLYNTYKISMYKIEWRKKAYRQLKKIKASDTRVKIYDAVSALHNWPECPNIKKMKNRSEYRLRVGNWRIIFDVEQALRIIEIEEVKKRNESTY
jgi:mRNA interferase RelE/StbE